MSVLKNTSNREKHRHHLFASIYHSYWSIAVNMRFCMALKSRSKILEPSRDLRVMVKSPPAGQSGIVPLRTRLSRISTERLIGLHSTDDRRLWIVVAFTRDFSIIPGLGASWKTI